MIFPYVNFVFQEFCPIHKQSLENDLYVRVIYAYALPTWF